jgi:hypothetical protein
LGTLIFADQCSWQWDRKHRQIGFARWHFDRVHRYGEYDLTLDTSRMSPEQCAGQLIALLRSDRPAVAFARIRKETREAQSP